MEVSLMACGHLHLTLPMIPGSGRKKGLCLKGLKERYRTDNPEPRTLDRKQSPGTSNGGHRRSSQKQ